MQTYADIKDAEGHGEDSPTPFEKAWNGLINQLTPVCKPVETFHDIVAAVGRAKDGRILIARLDPKLIGMKVEVDVDATLDCIRRAKRGEEVFLCGLVFDVIDAELWDKVQLAPVYKQEQKVAEKRRVMEIREGVFGRISDEAKQRLQKVFDSANTWHYRTPSGMLACGTGHHGDGNTTIAANVTCEKCLFSMELDRQQLIIDRALEDQQQPASPIEVDAVVVVDKPNPFLKYADKLGG
jgi:hypothetical protein